MKIIKFLSLVALAGITVTGCVKFSDFKVPTSVAVKTTDAKYNFTVVDLQDSDLLAKNFNIAEMLNKQMNPEGQTEGSENQEENSTKMNMYVYNPGGTAENFQMAMRMQLDPISLDVSQYLNNADFAGAIESYNIEEKKIEIPEIEKSGEEKLDIIDINSKINELLKFAGEATTEKQTINITFDPGNTFKKLKYKKGYIIIKGMTKEEIQARFPEVFENLPIGIPEELIPNGKPLVGKVTIQHVAEDGSTSEIVADFENNVAKIPLTDFEFYSQGTSIKFDDPEIEANPLIKKYYLAEVSQDSELYAAEGLSYSEPIELDIKDQVVPIKVDELKSCEIDEGKIKIGIKQPEGWSLGLEYEITLSQKDENGELAELFTITQADEEEGVSLKGTTIKLEDMYISGSAKINLNDSAIVLGEAPEFSYNLSIDKIKKAVVVMDENFKIDPVSQTVELPDEVLQYIKGVKWNPSGIVIKYKNNLPEGNDIKLVVSSEFLDLAQEEYTVEPGDGETEQTIDILCKQDWETPFGKEEGQFNKIDFSAELNLSNYNAADNTLVIYNVESKKTYTIGMTIEPQLDWQAIYIDSSIATQSGSFNTGVNLGSMLGDNEIFKTFADKIELINVPIYLYCDFPPLFGDDVDFEGNIKAYLADKEDATKVVAGSEKYFLGSRDAEGNEKNGTLVPCAEPEAKTNDEGELTTEYSSSSIKVAPSTMADLINTSLKEKDGVLYMDYSIGLTSKASGEGESQVTQDVIEITTAKLDEFKDKTITIGISAVIILPLEFNVIGDDGIDFDIASLINSADSSSEESEENSDKEEDLLKRSADDSSMDQISEYLKAIDKVGLTLSISKLPLKVTPATEGDGIKFVFDLDGNERTVSGEQRGTVFEPQALDLTNGQVDIDVEKLLETNPLVPTFGLKIPKGKFTFMRDMNISMNAKVNIQTKNDYKIKLFDFTENESESEE